MNSNIRIFKYISIISIALLLANCRKQYSVKEKKIFQNRQWARHDPVKVTFGVEHRKKMNIRAYITVDPKIYRFSNLYLKYFLKNNEGKVIRSELKEFFLSNPKNGDLYGTLSGDFHKKACSITENFNFEPGTYTAEFLQYMREDPLNGFISVEIVISDHSNL